MSYAASSQLERYGSALRPVNLSVKFVCVDVPVCTRWPAFRVNPEQIFDYLKEIGIFYKV